VRYRLEKLFNRWAEDRGLFVRETDVEALVIGVLGIVREKERPKVLIDLNCTNCARLTIGGSVGCSCQDYSKCRAYGQGVPSLFVWSNKKKEEWEAWIRPRNIGSTAVLAESWLKPSPPSVNTVQAQGVE